MIGTSAAPMKPTGSRILDASKEPDALEGVYKLKKTRQSTRSAHDHYHAPPLSEAGIALPRSNLGLWLSG